MTTNLDAFRDPSQFEWNLAVDTPASYCIRVVGHLGGSWSDRLGGMTIASSCLERGITVTTLSGVLVDQAALFGVLMALYNMRYPLLSVECLEIN